MSARREISLEEVETTGHCAHWCLGAVHGDHPRTGTPVDEHGAFCLGSQFGGVGQGAYGERRRLWLHPASEYFTGVETKDHRRARDDRDGADVGLFIEDGAELALVPTLRLTPAEARQLAAEMNYIADVVSGLDHPHASLHRR